jgi:Secretion system C-terminal sorting domain
LREQRELHPNALKPLCGDYKLLSKFVVTSTIGTNTLYTPHKEDFVLSPNPAQNNVHIAFDYPAKRQIKVYDSQGRLIQARFCDTDNSTLQIEHLLAGYYTVVVGSVSKVFIKQ